MASGGLGLLSVMPLLAAQGAMLWQMQRKGERSGRSDSMLFGLRSAATTVNDETWRVGHAAAAPLLRRAAWLAWVWSAIGIAVCFVASALWFTLAFGLVAFATVGILVWRAQRVANRAAREVTVNTGKPRASQS